MKSELRIFMLRLAFNTAAAVAIAALVPAAAFAGTPEGTPFTKPEGGDINTIMGGEAAGKGEEACHCSCDALKLPPQEFSLEERLLATTRLKDQAKADFKDLSDLEKSLKKQLKQQRAKRK